MSETGRLIEKPAESLETHLLSRRSIAAVFAALMISMFVGSLDQTIVSTALPTIVGELGAVNHMLWITTAYFLTSTITMPLYGKLGDLYGRKHLFCAAQVLFVVGSVICALGGTLGGNLIGSLFSANLAANMGEHVGAALGSIDANSLTPALVRELDEGVRQGVQLAYNDALAPVFGCLVPLLLTALAMLLFLKNKSLSTTNC